MPTLEELFKSKQLPSQGGKTAEEAYDIQNSKDIRISSSDPLVNNTGFAAARLLRKGLGVRGSETLLEEEVVGVRIIRGLSIPVIYGSDLPRLLLKTTPALSAMRTATMGELSELPEDNASGAIGGKIASAASSVKKTLGFPTLATPTYVVNELKKKKHIITKSTKGNVTLLGKDDFGLIKASADGIPTFVGGLLQGGNLKTIGRQALGSLIKLGKKEISTKLFGTGKRTGKSGKKEKGNTLISNSPNKFTNESIQWWLTTNINYGPDKTKTPEEKEVKTTLEAVDLNMNNTPYSKTVKPEGDTPKNRNDLSLKQQLSTVVLDEWRETPSDISPIMFSKTPEKIGKFSKIGKQVEYSIENNLNTDNKGFYTTKDTLNEQSVYDGTTKTLGNGKTLDELDFAPLKFYSIALGKTVQFRCTVTGLSETLSPSWDSYKFLGNPFSNYTYSGIERSISFNFKVYSLNAMEHKLGWERINFLTGLVYPQGYDSKTSALTPPFIRFTLGDLYKNKESFIESLSYTWDDTTPWNITDKEAALDNGEDIDMKNFKLPMITDIAVTIKFLESRKNTSNKNFYTFTPQTT
jgi:hypothetical protein